MIRLDVFFFFFKQKTAYEMLRSLVGSEMCIRDRLWSVYPEWGWGTEDSAQALGYLKKFGSVTVLNGHIHQTMQKVEGKVTFHTAMSTAFPQPAPGTAPS